VILRLTDIVTLPILPVIYFPSKLPFTHTWAHSYQALNRLIAITCYFYMCLLATRTDDKGSSKLHWNKGPSWIWNLTMQWLKMSIKQHHASVKTTTRCDLKLSCDPSFLIVKIFNWNMLPGIYFQKAGLFEIFKNKNPSKITCYTVHITCPVLKHLANICKCRYVYHIHQIVWGGKLSWFITKA